MYEKKLLRWIRGMLCIVWLLVAAFPVCVWADEDPEAKNEAMQTVRVAFPEQEGMSFELHSGKITGYNYDYLQKISEYTGWNIEYIIYPNASGTEAVGTALQDLMDGKVDLLGPMLKNEQTQKLLDFPENSYGTVYTTLCSLTSGSLRDTNFKLQKELRIGLWEQAETRNQEVIHYLDSENISYQLLYYPTSAEQLQALQNGEVDAISSVSLSPVANTRIVAQFAARPYYFATTKGNTALMQKLDETIEKLNRIQPHLQETLFQTYFHSSDDEFSLSGEQSAILSEMKELNVLCIDHDAPYVYQKNGEPTGMLLEILNDFGKETSLSIHYTFCQTREEFQEQVKTGRFDLLVGMPFTSSYCAQNGFIRSEPVIHSALAYVRSPYDNSNATIAIVNGLEEFIDTTAYEQFLLCDNAEECIQAVNSHKADLAAGDRSVMEYYIYESGSFLATSLISGENQDVCMAVSRELSPEFIAVLNNYVYNLSDTVKTGYLSSSNIHQANFSFSYLIRKYPGRTIALICLVVLLFVFFLFLSFYTRQINRKNEELRIANDAKSEFLTRISHDIRTPMNGIIGMLSMADKCADDPAAVRNYHERIRTASDYLLSLISDILDMSRMEGKQVELEDRSLSLHQMVENCVTFMEHQAEEADITLKTEGLEDFFPPRVFASERHVRQVLLNLLTNAIRYNRPGGYVLLKAAVTGRTATSVTCCFTIEDNGIGMSQEFQKQMFEPFSQENGGARSSLNGTGLGLSIVKKIVDYKGGTIAVDSQKGKGTTISVTLTFRIDQKYKKQEASEEPKEFSIAGMHILAAEDNDMNAELLELLLEDAGASITIVHDGQQLVKAFETMEPGTYDCILTDIMMPLMDGCEAASAIRSLDRTDARTIPIIALTANVSDEDARRSKKAGINAHIPKPFDINYLKKTLYELKISL